ncbi:hypothetical protein LOK49_LG01G02678 [Camellia lanceoleosa]|uniref:Uncharacterized protein n=1 Tax=Camellia lanceoleosa TaxID=1840588 RepID=A0ACC0IYR8_9ERIC|nr:hypothetical protein LOK49_LG01G02678 [Camellia lanceoleosa]
MTPQATNPARTPPWDDLAHAPIVKIANFPYVDAKDQCKTVNAEASPLETTVPCPDSCQLLDDLPPSSPASTPSST